MGKVIHVIITIVMIAAAAWSFSRLPHDTDNKDKKGRKKH